MSSVTEQAAASVLSHDAFASLYLGRPVYRLSEVGKASEAVTLLPVGPIPGLIEAKVPTHAVESLGVLTAAGFRVIDTNVQLDVAVAALTPAADGGGNWSIRDAVAADRVAVERVSGENLTTSRFHLDPRIDFEAASRLKSAWAGNYFDGRRGDRLLVIEAAGQIRGFLQVLERGAQGIIDLVALDPVVRGTGALAGLVHAWINRAPALERIVVGTQISNTRSLRAYGRLGFRVCGTTYVLHYQA